MRQWLLTVALGGLCALFAGCGPECVPEEGLGPDVSWGYNYAYAKTGEAVKLDLWAHAQNIVDGYTVHGKCEGDGEAMSGTVEVVPSGGTVVGGALVDGRFATSIPYTTAIDLRVDTTQPERGTFTEHWELPSVFTLAAAPSGTNVVLTWTPPAADYGEIEIEITDFSTNNNVFMMKVPDTGSLSVPTAMFPHPGEYYVTGTRSHPAPPYYILRIWTTYIHP